MRRHSHPRTRSGILSHSLKVIRAVPERNPADGSGRVQMPTALDLKCPAAPKDRRWQWVSPQENKNSMRVMRKPYKRPRSGDSSPEPLNIQGLCQNGCAVMSGSKTRKTGFIWKPDNHCSATELPKRSEVMSWFSKLFGASRKRGVV